jgi:hypothetical protein
LGNQSSPEKPRQDQPQVRAVAETGTNGAGYAQSRAVRMLYMARLAKLEYEIRSGKLVSVEDVKQKAFNQARTVRDRLLNIPDRIVPLVTVETDPQKIELVLMAEIRDALTELRSLDADVLHGAKR